MGSPCPWEGLGGSEDKNRGQDSKCGSGTLSNGIKESKGLGIGCDDCFGDRCEAISAVRVGDLYISFIYKYMI